MTKDELLGIAWPGVVVEENNLQVQISALRKVLGPQAFVTMPGRGYRFAMALDADAAVHRERSVDAPERRAESRSAAEHGEGPRLAAVVVTDVVGYSARMQRDEAGTIAFIQADFERMRVLCGQHGGESLNSMGDGLLLRFPSALQAVKCALEIQREFHVRDGGGDQAPLEHRIGVHLGDVFHLESGDVAGDGVNIAARLEAKASPGGICLSQTVYDTVKGKLPMQARFLGPERFKNIAEPIPIWLVVPEGMSLPEGVPAPPIAPSVPPVLENANPTVLAKRRTSNPRLWLVGAVVALVLLAPAGWYLANRQAPAIDARSVAVLPFTNMSADKDAAYFADGIHEDLLTQLALLRDLKVVSRTSVMDYRDTKKNMRQIGTELGVGTLVEGSVRRAGSRVRVSAQLIDAHGDKHLWGKSYDRELKDIFAIQGELAAEIAGALKGALLPQEQARLSKRPTDNLAAYDLFLRYQDLLNRSIGWSQLTATSNERIKLLERAVALDGNFALAWARLAVEYAHDWKTGGLGIAGESPSQRKATEFMDRALALRPDDLQVQIAAGTYYRLALNDNARAAASFTRILENAPDNIEGLRGLAGSYIRQSRIADGMQLLQRAYGVDARNASILSMLSWEYLSHRQYDRAQAFLQQLIDLHPGNLDLQSDYHFGDYLKTGSWDGYDRWRRTIAPDEITRSFWLQRRDLFRAVSRRDFAEALRLAVVVPDMFKDILSDRSVMASFAGDQQAMRALLQSAMGDRAGSLVTAKKAMKLIEQYLVGEPRDAGMWIVMAQVQALLHLRDQAFRSQARAVTLARAHGGGAWLEGEADRALFEIYALLGDHARALEEIARQLQVPGNLVGHIRVNSIALAPLWDDARFLALVNDPKSNAPLAIQNRLRDSSSQ